MITNKGQMCLLHSNCRKEYTFMMCVNVSLLLSRSPLLEEQGILLTAAASGTLLKLRTNQSDLATVLSKSLNSGELTARTWI